MELFKSSITILIAWILFLQISKLYTNGEISVSVAGHDKPSVRIPINNSTCTRVISRKLSQFIPYMQILGLHHRLNYRKEYHTVNIVEHECCKDYVQIGTECVPHCPQSCKKGYCSEPNVCICHAGYRASNDTNDKETCVPVCTNGCINGTCIEPDICNCNEDYWMDSDGFTCRPICDEECEHNYGYCYEPHVCSCRSGYKKTGNDSTSFACEPICDHACTNGYCAAPNVCKCLDGYEVDQLDRFTCIPKCDEICVFGACMAPQICFCNNGYTAVNASVCEPICSKPCKNGTCVAPETCSCNDGYRNGNPKYECEPICEMGCSNGTCVAPEICICDEGFVYDNQTNPVCKPHCAIPCEPNQRCTSPDTCTCSEGYRLRDRRLNTKLLWESFSVAVNRYIWNKRYRPICEPVCNFECIKGTCTAPNICTCYEDYEPSWIKSHQLSLPLDNSTTRICVPRGEPICNPSCGNNEICTASLTCNCYNGYTRHADNSSCVPLCAQGCSNGTCTAPDRCTCNAGFVLRNESFCEPICERGCQNGDCIGPNYCICHDNFIPNTGSSFETECIPICRRNCSDHGACIIEDDKYRCKCHYGWTGWDCNQPTVCIITMDLNSSDINRITIRNDTNNSIIMEAHKNAPHCYQCNHSLNKNSLCYLIHSDKGNMIPIVGCLLSTDLPCYLTPHYSVSINVAKIVWPLVAIVILIAMILIAAAYLMYRRYEKKKLITASMPTNLFVRESFVTESLLSENEIDL